MFIAVHQVDELWLKLVLRDLTVARDLFAGPRVPDDALAGACRTLDRIRIILELATDHFRLMETMTTRDYLEFRDKLFPANGGQSPQFREVEILMGLRESERLPFVKEGSYLDVLKQPDGSEGWPLARVKARKQDTPTLKDAVDTWLLRTPINGSGPDDDGDREVVDTFVESYLNSQAASLSELAGWSFAAATSPGDIEQLKERYDAEQAEARAFLRAEDVSEPERLRFKRIRAAMLFIETYRELPLLAWPREVLDGIVAVEQACVTFRQRHARMAERIIGRRVGTGGSTGVDYLDETALRYRIFPDLWAVRTLLVRRDRVPDPEQAAVYGFQFEAV
jgi:tryptophan 2,3-dioxygenase